MAPIKKTPKQAGAIASAPKPPKSATKKDITKKSTTIPSKVDITKAPKTAPATATTAITAITATTVQENDEKKPWTADIEFMSSGSEDEDENEIEIGDDDHDHEPAMSLSTSALSTNDSDDEKNAAPRRKEFLGSKEEKALTGKISQKMAAMKGLPASSSSSSPGVVYLGRIPHGFYEEQMQAYFAQFGTVTRLRLSRNKKTGKSKHYAFLEFEHKDVAEVVAETMDNYLLFSHLLKCTSSWWWRRWWTRVVDSHPRSSLSLSSLSSNLLTPFPRRPALSPALLLITHF